jgi:hypothetical protein
MVNLYKQGYFWENVPRIHSELLTKEAQAGVFVDFVKSTLWRPEEGPFENIFRLGTYLMPFVSGWGFVLMIVDKIASTFFHMGLEDFGRWLDRKLGLGPRSDITQDVLNRGQNEVLNMLQGIEQSGSKELDSIVKVAFLGGLLRWLGFSAARGFSRNRGGLTGLVRTIFSVIGKAIGFLTIAFGANKFNDIYKMVIDERIPQQQELGQGEQMDSPEEPISTASIKELKEIFNITG